MSSWCWVPGCCNAPQRQRLDLLPCCCWCIVCKLGNGVGTMYRRVVVGEEGVEEWTQHIALWDASVEGEGWGVAVILLNILGSVGLEVQYPVAILRHIFDLSSFGPNLNRNVLVLQRLAATWWEPYKSAGATQRNCWTVWKIMSCSGSLHDKMMSGVKPLTE